MVVTQYHHPSHPGGLVCPRCGKTTVVLHGDSTYVCLDHQCGFRHDVSEGGVGFVGKLAAVVLGFLLMVVVFDAVARSSDIDTNLDEQARQSGISTSVEVNIG